MFGSRAGTVGNCGFPRRNHFRSFVPDQEPRFLICLIVCLMSRKHCNQELSAKRVCGHSWVRRSMEIMFLGCAAVVLIVSGAVIYGVRTESASDRTTEPRRRRPF